MTTRFHLKYSINRNFFYRFSEPCLLNVASSEVQNDSRPNCLNNDNLGNVPSTSASNVEASTNKLFAVIMEHIQQLHDTNSKIYRNLHETKGRKYIRSMSWFCLETFVVPSRYN